MLFFDNYNILLGDRELSEEKKTLTYRDSGIDERIIRAVEELGFEHMTPTGNPCFLIRKRCDRTGTDRNGKDRSVRDSYFAKDKCRK